MGDKHVLNRSRKRFTVRFGPGGPQFAGFTKNLSETGLYLKTPKTFEAGTRLDLQIRGGDRVFEMTGTVVWAKMVPPRLAMALESGMGVAFDSPSAEWREFCARLQKA